ncbi:hypothetical protein MPSEU_000193100 [Mayamaea pseudoterrestris]|nr:hypothetical protein MPSEU_000193100 [Mayamaea pseudoterrestris]
MTSTTPAPSSPNAPPSSPLVALPQLTATKVRSSPPPSGSTNDDEEGETKAAADTNDDEDDATNETQLSQDLALFLANPSLRAALADGSLDLVSYSDQIHSELDILESQCIQVYRDRQPEIKRMHQDLHECQGVLNSLQEMLLGFQADLGGLSVEIQNLQTKSRTLDVQLRNRKRAKEGLEQFLVHMVVSPNLVNVLTTGPVIHPQYVLAVKELEQIYQHAHENTPQPWACDTAPSHTQAGRELHESLTALRHTAVTRVRQGFLQQMSLLSLTNHQQTNVRMLQVHGLLKYSALQDFLQRASPVVAQELFAVYVERMSKTMATLFSTYQAQLLQLDVTRKTVLRQDVIAVSDAWLQGRNASNASGGWQAKRSPVFQLGTRASDCLAMGGENNDDDEDDNEDGRPGESSAAEQPIIAHVALSEQKQYHYERLFRSLISHLCEAVTNEHVFCRQFFKRDGFTPLFQTTLGILLEQLENYLFACYDALCLLLMIKVTHAFKRQMRLRKIHSLDSFFDQITRLLWPRLKTVMDQNLKSLQAATPAQLGAVEDSWHPNFVSRRMAEFCCSVLTILHRKTMSMAGSDSGRQHKHDKDKSRTPQRPSATAMSTHTTPIGDDAAKLSAGDKLLEDLDELTQEYWSLLQRLADIQTTHTKRVVFLINNLDVVVGTFQERRVVGKEFNYFVEHLMRQREVFVEEELLATGFSKLIAFCQQTEAHIAATPKGETYDVNMQVVESLVVDFASNWRSNMELINRNVLSYFSNFRNGMEILKQVLTQLLLYYTRFHDIIRKVWRNKPPAFCKDLVSTNVILTEIKKYALAI